MHVWNWAARADCAGLLPRMSCYPRSRSTADHTSSIFLAAWLVPVPADSYRPDARYKAKQNITEDDRNRIYYFYADSFLVFKNLQLVLEITCGRSCELLSCSQMEDVFCQMGSISRWLLKGRLWVELSVLLQSRSGSFKPSQTVLNQALNVCRAHTLERNKGQTGLTGHFLGRKESLGKTPCLW